MESAGCCSNHLLISTLMLILLADVASCIKIDCINGESKKYLAWRSHNFKDSDDLQSLQLFTNEEPLSIEPNKSYICISSLSREDVFPFYVHGQICDLELFVPNILESRKSLTLQCFTDNVQVSKDVENNRSIAIKLIDTEIDSNEDLSQEIILPTCLLNTIKKSECSNITLRIENQIMDAIRETKPVPTIEGQQTISPGSPLSLSCNVNAPDYVSYRMYWDLPGKVEDSNNYDVYDTLHVKSRGNALYGTRVSRLTVREMSYGDSIVGNYSCVVISNKKDWRATVTVSYTDVMDAVTMPEPAEGDVMHLGWLAAPSALLVLVILRLLMLPKKRHHTPTSVNECSSRV